MLKHWWADKRAVNPENVHACLSELGVGPQDKIGFHKLCEIAAALVRLVGSGPPVDDADSALGRSGARARIFDRDF